MIKNIKQKDKSNKKVVTYSSSLNLTSQTSWDPSSCQIPPLQTT